MTEKIKAVHDDDLEELLESLGIKNKFEARELKCTFCQEIITFDNLHSIFPDSGSIKLTCSKSDCVKLLMGRIEEKQYGNIS